MNFGRYFVSKKKEVSKKKMTCIGLQSQDLESLDCKT